MGAKILHTSDWHLGKKLFREERVLEHKAFLKWLKETLIQQKIDLLLIAGDIFDVPSPPHAAFETFNYFLHELGELGIKVFIIGGNHDSAMLLEAALPFYKDKSIIVDGKLKENLDDHIHFFEINQEKFLIQSLPYFRNFEIYEWIKKYVPEKIEIEERGEAIEKVLENFFSLTASRSEPKILCSHHLFGHFIEAGSEQSLNLSGLDSVPLRLLENKFDYVALGHIHKPQILKKENPIVQYSGSPIAMRFSEKEKKMVNIIEINQGSLKVEKIDIPVFRELSQITSDLLNWKNEVDKIEKNEELECFVEIILKLEGPIAGLVDQVKNYVEEKGHKLLSYFPQYQGEEAENQEKLDRRKINELSPTDLFKLYYKEKFPEDLNQEDSDHLIKDFISLYQKAENKDEN